MEEGISELEAGYSDDDKAMVETPEPVKDEVPEQKASEPTEAVKEEQKYDPLKELMTRFEKIESRTRNVEGHIGGLNSGLRSLNETLAASRVAAQAVSEAPTTAQVKDAVGNTREWDALKEDFPEWASATEKLLDSKLGKRDDIQAVLDERLNGVTANISERIKHEAGMESLYVAFPDWEQDVKTPEFRDWYAEQDDGIKALSASPKPTDAARMMRMFERRKPKESKPDPVTSRQERMKAAITPKGTGGGSTSRSDIDDFMAGYSG